MADRLTPTRAFRFRFRGAGIKSADAERIATEIYDAIHDNVATKADLRDLEQRLENPARLVDCRGRCRAFRGIALLATTRLTGGVPRVSDPWARLRS